MDSKREYDDSEKWDLFAKNFKGVWHGGFNLLSDHENDNLVYKSTFFLATILHWGNLGIFTSLLPATIKTLVDLQSREALTEAEYDRTNKFLNCLTPENLETIINALNHREPSSNSSKQLIQKLQQLNSEIKELKEALRAENREFKNISEINDFEKNPIIAGKRITQKDCLKEFFNSRVNIGKKTQRMIFEIIEGFNAQAEAIHKITDLGFKA